MKRGPIKDFSCTIDGQKYELNQQQIELLNDWLTSVIDKIDQKYRSTRDIALAEHFKERGQVYAGVIGGNLSFTVTPTSLGTVIKVTESITGETLDLSDYDNW